MKRTLILFDVDGTLTIPRGRSTPEIHAMIKNLRDAGYKVGIVGGSDLVKQQEQLGPSILEEFNYAFSENGLMAWKDGKLFHQQSFAKYLGEEKLQEFINFTLHTLADIKLPMKRGTFIEFRKGMLNVSPIGRNCSQEERVEYEKFDLANGIRKDLIKKWQEKFPDLGLKYSIGGQISIDVFPVGWDKTYCLQHIEKDFDEIYFFGDKTFEGGNDWEIANSDKIKKAFTVISPEDTQRFVKETFLIKNSQI